MKPINTRLHGMLDYASAFILILPWIATHYENSTDTMILASLGLLTAIFSVLTDYELGLIKLLPMKVHLALDVLSALFLIAMPWLFPVANYQFYWPSLLGLAELLVIFISSSQPYAYKRRDFNITQP